MGDGIGRLASDAIVGALAALRTPRVINSSLRSLIEPSSQASLSSHNADRPIRYALGALQLLSRIPGGYWRNTCLFQSVAECIVRRARGWPARVVIGVARDNSAVIAHSWVEVAGAPAAGISMASLRPSRQPGAE
ncbi:MAG TPA: lasso peptide biosynthesis B2 protein [Gemmatimonadaceae bacterium]|jgi:hypothetical protein